MLREGTTFLGKVAIILRKNRGQACEPAIFRDVPPHAVARYAGFDSCYCFPRVCTRGFMLVTRYAASKSSEFSEAELERHPLNVTPAIRRNFESALSL